MIRKIATGLMLSVFAGAVVIGCGKADLTEGQATWTSRADEISAKLQEVQTAYTDLSGKHQSMPVADMAPEKKAQYDQLGQSLSAEEATLKSVSETLEAQKTAMQAAVEAGDQAGFDAAWATAKTAYDEAMNKLDAVSTNLNNIRTQSETLMAAPAAADTAAAPADASAPAEGADAAKKEGDAKKEEPKKEEAAKKDDKKGM